MSILSTLAVVVSVTTLALGAPATVETRDTCVYNPDMGRGYYCGNYDGNPAVLWCNDSSLHWPCRNNTKCVQGTSGKGFPSLLCSWDGYYYPKANSKVDKGLDGSGSNFNRAH